MDHVQIPETTETIGFCAQSVNASQTYIAAEVTKEGTIFAFTGSQQFQ